MSSLAATPGAASALTPDEAATIGLLAGALRGMAEEGARAAYLREAEPRAAAGAAGKAAAVAAPRRFRPALPRSFVCPITHLLMRDPVTTEAGFFYERAAIEEWLGTHEVDPQNRKYGNGTCTGSLQQPSARCNVWCAPCCARPSHHGHVAT